MIMLPKGFKKIDRAIHIGDSKTKKIQTTELENPIICANDKDDFESLKRIMIAWEESIETAKESYKAVADFLD